MDKATPPVAKETDPAWNKDAGNAIVPYKPEDKITKPNEPVPSSLAKPLSEEDKIVIRPEGVSQVEPIFDFKQFREKLNAAKTWEEVAKLLMGLHVRFWHAPPHDMITFLKALGVENKGALKIAFEIPNLCKDCCKYKQTKHKPPIKITLAVRFNDRVQMDIYFCWDMSWLLMVDEAIRYKIVEYLIDHTPNTLLSAIMKGWVRYFGPMNIAVMDQEGALVSEISGRFADRLNVTREFAGTDDHTGTGLAERHIMLTRLAGLKLWESCVTDGLEVTKQDCMFEAAMCQNLVLSYDSGSPAQALFGTVPRDYYTLESCTLESHASSLESNPDPFETAVRLRLKGKECVLRAVVEERLAKANATRVQKQDLEQLHPGVKVDIFRLPDRKDQSGWRGPGELAHLSPSMSTAVVIWNGYPYLLPLRHVRKHIGYVCFLLLQQTARHFAVDHHQGTQAAAPRRGHVLAIPQAGAFGVEEMDDNVSHTDVTDDQVGAALMMATFMDIVDGEQLGKITKLAIDSLMTSSCPRRQTWTAIRPSYGLLRSMSRAKSSSSSPSMAWCSGPVFGDCLEYISAPTASW